MKLPCEVVSRYLLPTIRALITQSLIEEYGFTQMNAAVKLGLTQSAMSRYITMSRGRKIENIKKIQKLLEDMTESIAKSHLPPEEIILKMCNICVIFRESGDLCEIHRAHASVPEKCELCQKILAFIKPPKNPKGRLNRKNTIKRIEIN